MLSAQERTAQEIWLLILKNLESRMSEQTISTWFISSHAVSMTGENLTIELKNRFIAQYVEQSYQNTLNQVATKALGRPFKINLIYRQRHEQIDLWDQENVAKYSVSSLVEQQEPVDTAPEPSTHKKKPGSKKRTAPGKKRAPLKGTLNPRYTFKNFVVGSNSRLAHAAALSVSNAPAISYNPLFIYGGVGLGKTHLMQAIGRELLDSSKFGKLEIGYLTTEEFLNELIAAITSGSTSSFRRRYRRMDVLLVDDVQFLSKKEGTQEEFFHTFNTLYENQKQIVMTSDRPPRDIKHLEERLSSRFQWGLVADIQPPEFETRMAILKQKSLLRKIIIPENVLEYIAEKITGNVRILEGSLHYLKHCSDTQKVDINLELAETVLKNIFNHESSHISVENITTSVCDVFDTTEKKIFSIKRKKSHVEPRQISMYLCNKLTNLSTSEIAERFHRKDHTTVMHACRKIGERILNDSDFKIKIHGIIDNLRNQNLNLEQ